MESDESGGFTGEAVSWRRVSTLALINKEELVKLRKRLHSDVCIARELGITKQAVYRLRKKYEITSSRSRIPKRNQKIIESRLAGKSVAAIARKFRLSPPMVYRILTENNIKKPPKKNKDPVKPLPEGSKKKLNPYYELLLG